MAGSVTAGTCRKARSWLLLLVLCAVGVRGGEGAAFGRKEGLRVGLTDFADRAAAFSHPHSQPHSLPHDTPARAARLAKCVADVRLPPACHRMQQQQQQQQPQAHDREHGRGQGDGEEPPYEVPPADYRGVYALADAPPALYTRCDVDAPGQPTHAIAHKRHSLAELRDGGGSRWSRAHLPTALVTFCVPGGMVVDATIAGPSSQRGVTAMRAAAAAAAAAEGGGSGGALPAPVLPVLIQQHKLWNIELGGFQDWLRPRAEQRGGAPVQLVDVAGMGVQLSSWTGWMFNHFSLDTLIRLGLVYDKLVGSDPLWGSAKVVVSLGMKGIDGAPADVQKTVQWIFEKLRLTDRLAGNTAWLAKATRTQRFEYLVFPDVHPLYHCGRGFGARTKDPVFLRGTLLPVQRALGVLDPTAPRDLIVWAGRRGRRALNPARKAAMLAGVAGLLRKHGLAGELAVHDWHHEGSVQHDFEVFRRAWIVIGPHGGQLWNFAFAKPGTQMVEFTTWEDTFVAEDCRTCGFSLANAAGHEYAIVDTPDWENYGASDLKPAAEDLLELVDGFLGRNAAAIRASPRGAPTPAPPCASSRGGQRGAQCHANFIEKAGLRAAGAEGMAEGCRRACAAQPGCAEWSVSAALGCRIAQSAEGCNRLAGHGWNKAGCADGSCEFHCEQQAGGGGGRAAAGGGEGAAAAEGAAAGGSEPAWVALPGFETRVRTLREGAAAGAAVQKGDRVTVHAVGIVQATGKQFWSTRDAAGSQPFSYEAGVGGVITGWDQGCLGMRLGEKRALDIPAREGYGAGGNKAWGIPKNGALLFTIEVLAIKKSEERGE